MTDDIGGSAQAAEETTQSIGGVVFDRTDARQSPVNFEGKEITTSKKSASDFYKPAARGGRGLSDEEVEAVLVDAGVKESKAE